MRIKRPVLLRLMARVIMLPPPAGTAVSGCCWIWPGADDGRGYGQIWDDGRMRRTHIVAWEEFEGPVPEGLMLDHLCRVRLCCNPDHLEPVTNRVNVLRGVSPIALLAAITACKNGHDYDQANTYWRPNGNRDCRSCHRERQRQRQGRANHDHQNRVAA